MAISRSQYIELLKNLLPRGLAWSRQQGTALHSLFEAMADEFYRFDQRLGTDLIKEADPSTTNEMLVDWERLVGIPDGVFSDTVGTDRRRSNMLSKLTARGGQSIPYFIALAAELGFVVTITEFRPFRVGFSEPGDALTNGDWNFTWRVNAENDITDAFLVGLSTVGDSLSTSSTSILEGALNRSKPAHTILQFAYS